MHLTGLIPVLSCRSVEASVSFYQQTLQFVVLRSRKGSVALEWVYLKSGDSVIMLEQACDKSASSTGISLYFYIDDIRSFHQYLVAKGINPTPLESTAYGLLQCQFQDPDGYVIQIGENLNLSKS
jgi:uncharacterized glyoxalase superfamily protein PhnB